MRQIRWIVFTLFAWIAMAASPSTAMPAITLGHGMALYASRNASTDAIRLASETTSALTGQDEPVYRSPAGRKVTTPDGKADALPSAGWQPLCVCFFPAVTFEATPLSVSRRKSVASSPRAPPFLSL